MNLYRVFAVAALLLGVFGCAQHPDALEPAASWTPDPIAQPKRIAAPGPKRAPGETVKAPKAPEPTDVSPVDLPLDTIRAIAMHLVSLSSDNTYESIEVKREGTLVRVLLGDKAAKAPDITVHLSPDGRELYQGGIALAERLRQLEGDRALGACMAERKIRVYVERGTKESEAQMAELGVFSDRFVIDCAVAPANCKVLGVMDLPHVRGGNRNEPGFHKRPWFLQFGECDKGDDKQVASPLPPTSPGAVPQAANRAAPLPSVEELGERVAQMYRLAQRAEIDVLESRREGPVVRVSMQRRGSRLTPVTAFVTPDGARLFESAIHVAPQVELLQDDRRFAECLTEAQFKAYVAPDDEASAAQIAALGAFGWRVIVNCKDAAEQCTNAKITKLPALVTHDRGVSGFHTRAWIETFTGCK